MPDKKQSDSGKATLEEVLKQLDPKQKNALTWQQLGTAILQLEALGYPDQYTGTGHWLEALLVPLGYKRASAWRYRANAKSWPWLQAELTKVGIKTPEFGQLEPAVSAEKLEILMKLVKTTPPEIWKPAAQRVLDQSMPLGEIRRLWAHYRPLLQGQTARSRGSVGFVQSISVNEAAPDIPHKRYISQACQWLDEHYLALLEHITGGRVVRRCFTHDLQELVAYTDIRPSAVSALTFTGRHIPVIHAFVITPDPKTEPDLRHRLEALHAYVDAVWLVTPEAFELPGLTGSILFDGNNFDGFTFTRKDKLREHHPKIDLIALWLLNNTPMLHVNAQNWPYRPNSIALRLKKICDLGERS